MIHGSVWTELDVVTVPPWALILHARNRGPTRRVDSSIRSDELALQSSDPCLAGHK